MTVDTALVDEVLSRVSATLDARDNEAPMKPRDRQQFVRAIIAVEIERLNQLRLEEGGMLVDVDDEVALEVAVFNRIFGLAQLQVYIDDPNISDIHVNGCNDVWLTYRDGSKVRGLPVAASDEELVAMIQTAARRGGGALSEKSWDFSSPMLDLRLPSGDRLNALAWVCRRPSVSVRRHDFEIAHLKQLVGSSISESLCEFLSAAVKARRNIIIAGGTGAGKTTLLRCMINEIDPSERLITVEDSLELGLHRFGDRHADLVEVEARTANSEGVGAFGLADAVRNTLRMAPDRVIVGEIRGDEVLPMLLAMSQGNDGSLSTIHADSSSSVFQRLQMYMGMTAERFPPAVTNMMVAGALHLVVHIARMSSTERVVTSVREVRGAQGDMIVSNEIYAPDESGRAVPDAPPSDALLEMLETAGFDRRWLTSPGAGRWS